MRIHILESLAKKSDTFTFKEALKATQLQKEVLWVVLSRLEKKGWIERIEKGKYMIIPLGAEKGKYTLNEFVIGALLIQPYCIAYWSALHHYGLTEQIPNKVFIQTTARKKKQEIAILGVNYRLIRIIEEKFLGIRKEWIGETEINITDREKTIIDCLDKPQHCGGIVEVAKALKHGDFNGKKLLQYGKQIENSGVMRRLGYLCDFFDIDLKVPMIETRNYLLLDPTMPQKDSRNAKWRLITNLDEKTLGMLE